MSAKMVTKQASESAEVLSQRLAELAGSSERRGLALRPPRRFLRLLHMVQQHAAAVAFRPISFGNRSYLEERVDDLARLRREIEEAIPSLRPEWKTVSEYLCVLLRDISLHSKKKDYVQVVKSLDQTHYRNFWEQAVTIVPAPSRALLDRKYKKIVVVLGPAIGLGDEISTVEFVQALRRKYAKTPMDLHTYYPALWHIREPGVTIHSLVGHPMRVFDCVDDAVQEHGADKVLIVFINFTGLQFHLGFSLEKVKPDIVEIAVGKSALWFAPADGGPILFRQTMDLLYPDNYRGMSQVRCALMGERFAQRSGGPSTRPSGKGRDRREFKIVLSPFTSKPIILAPQDWVALVHATLKTGHEARKPVRCQVLPGLSDHSKNYARAILEEAKQMPRPGLVFELLNGGKITNPDESFERIYGEMAKADLVLGIDTYTAHLSAMLKVPSVALCYDRNVAFWPDATNSFWIEIGHDLKTIAELTSLVFVLAGGLRDEAHRQFIGNLPVARFNRLEKQSRIDAGKTTDVALIRYFDRAWELLPGSIQSLMNKIDANYAWPTIRPWIQTDRYDAANRKWVLHILKRSHFRKLARWLAMWGERPIRGGQR